MTDTLQVMLSVGRSCSLSPTKHTLSILVLITLIVTVDRLKKDCFPSSKSNNNNNRLINDSIVPSSTHTLQVISAAIELKNQQHDLMKTVHRSMEVALLWSISRGRKRGTIDSPIDLSCSVTLSFHLIKRCTHTEIERI
jgi:hypothetical protein